MAKKSQNKIFNMIRKPTAPPTKVFKTQSKDEARLEEMQKEIDNYQDFYDKEEFIIPANFL